jgi:hypothetical protein
MFRRWIDSYQVLTVWGLIGAFTSTIGFKHAREIWYLQPILLRTTRTHFKRKDMPGILFIGDWSMVCLQPDNDERSIAPCPNVGVTVIL